jgi:hypothetical protein
MNNNNIGYKKLSLEDSTKWLWCGGSVFCRCGHHVEDHYNTEYVCHFGAGSCDCKEFISYRVKEELM